MVVYENIKVPILIQISMLIGLKLIYLFQKIENFNLNK